jgi:hypothetical protein
MGQYAPVGQAGQARLVGREPEVEADVAIRQHILILWLQNGNLASGVCAWSRYLGDSTREPTSGEEEGPPYPSALAALRDGWRVLQYPVAVTATPGQEHRTGFLKHEVVLERHVEVDAPVRHV